VMKGQMWLFSLGQYVRVKLNRMKNKFLFIISLLGLNAMAQIPNADFENWSGGEPVGWTTANSSIPGSTTQSGTAHSGSSSVQLNSVQVASFYSAGSIVSGNDITQYFYNSGSPAALHGWYMLNSVGGDYISIDAVDICYTDSAHGAGVKSLTTSTSVWKEFVVCENYVNACPGDSFSILIWLTNQAVYTNSGSYARIDDLSFGPCVTAIDEVSSNVCLEKVYPNPAKGTCNVIYSIPTESMVGMSIYDLSGRKVTDVLSDTYQSSGRYKLPVDVTGLTNGMYLCMLMVNGEAYIEKVVVEN
jgi:Secretion system C-terminal sorting domain